MLRVLCILNNAFNYGGIESVVLNYYHHMDNNIRIHFAVHATENEFENSKLTQELLKQGTIVFRITPRKESIKNNIRDLTRLMSKSYDIVHTHTDAVGSGILRIAKRCGIKHRIAHSHNTGFPVKADSLKNAIKLLYLGLCRYTIRLYATEYMACSFIAAKWLFGEKIAKRTYILNNAIDTKKYVYSEEDRDKLRKEMDLQNAFVIGNVGRLDYQKNQEFLLRCFAKIIKKKPTAKLLLVGDGPDRNRLNELAEKLGITKDVIFFGNTDEVSKILNIMDVFVLPSLFEGFGIVLLEAQANGLYCIVNDTPRIPSDTDLTGRIKRISIDDPDSWIKELSCVTYNRDSDLISRFTEMGYDIGTEANKLSQYYKNLI